MAFGIDFIFFPLFYHHVGAAFFALDLRNVLFRRFDVFAGRIVGAGEIFAESAVLSDHGAAALVAQDIGYFIAVRLRF